MRNADQSGRTSQTQRQTRVIICMFHIRCSGEFKSAALKGVWTEPLLRAGKLFIRLPNQTQPEMPQWPLLWGHERLLNLLELFSLLTKRHPLRPPDAGIRQVIKVSYGVSHWTEPDWEQPIPPPEQELALRLDHWPVRIFIESGAPDRIQGGRGFGLWQLPEGFSTGERLPSSD